MSKPSPRFETVNVGDELQPLSVPVTVPLITGGAIATRDYQNVHHDADAARALGSPHIFMNILITNGLVQRFVESWAGSGSRLMDLKIRLGAPNYPGDTLQFTGAITGKHEATRSVQVALKGTNSMGAHVSGTVQVALP